jgi:hypothetical protein
MAFTEDLSPFFDTDEFAVSALWNGTTTVPVIFDNAYDEGIGMAALLPIVTGKAADFPGVAAGQTLLINGVTYKIDTPQPDGTGLVTLILKK